MFLSKLIFSFYRFSPFLFVFVGPGLYRKLREVKGFISSKFGPDPSYWGRVMSKNVKSVFINFLISRFSPVLFVFVGPGLYRKLREVKGFISSKFGPNPTYWGRVMSNTVSSFLIVLISNCPGGGFGGPGGGFGGPGGGFRTGKSSGKAATTIGAKKTSR